VEVHVLGARGSRPVPAATHLRHGGDTSCVALALDGAPPTLVLDAGTGITHLGALLGDEPFRGTILLGHLHWDHVIGLPFVRAADRPDARVDLFLPTTGGADAAAVLARSMSPPHFPIGPEGLRGQWRFAAIEPGRHELDGFSVLALEIPHKGGRTFGFRIEAGGASIAYLSDHGPTALGPGPDGHGERHEAALRLAEGVDLLIHDAQHTATEFPPVAHFGHCTIDYAIALGNQARAAHVLLFHHDPGHSDEFLDDLTPSLPAGATFATQGSVIRLPGDRVP
jgi:ribonuclease BN (tRNA processing enzyme)